MKYLSLVLIILKSTKLLEADEFAAQKLPTTAQAYDEYLNFEDESNVNDFEADADLNSVDSDYMQEDGILDEPDAHDEDLGYSQKMSYAHSSLFQTLLNKLEVEMQDLLEEYETALEQRLSTLRRYKQDYQESSLKALQEFPEENTVWQAASYLTGHPTLVHLMLRRFARDIETLEGSINQNYENIVLRALRKWKRDLDWPGSDDVHQSIRSILRIQSVYNISAEEISVGIFGDIGTAVGLPAIVCYEIAEHALELGDTLSAAEWLKVANLKLNYLSDKSVQLGQLTELWERVASTHGKLRNVNDISFFDIFAAAQNEKHRNYIKLSSIRSFENKQYNYQRICRQANFLVRPVQVGREVEGSNHLYCWLETRSNAYWTINPLQMELHSENPRVVEIHEFIGEEVVRFVSNEALPLLMDDMTQPTGEISRESHTSSSIWLNDQSHNPTVRKLEKKIELATGLKIGGASRVNESFLISTYAFGCHLDPCLDCEEWRLEHDKVILGDRIASLHIMMEDAQFGGDLVFPMLGVHIKPERGSALLWFPRKRNGEIDDRLMHAKCPLVLGHTWEAIKWLYQNDNIFQRKCSLSRDD